MHLISENHSDDRLLSRRFRADESVVEAPVEGEVVLLHVDTGVYYGLTGVGHTIWELLKEGHTESAIVTAIHDEFEVELRVVTDDVHQLMSELLQAGLIHSFDTEE
ncbi:MAG: PqqD family protein [Chloroflexota bacterium]